MKLSILIVNWNSADYVRRCLQSLEAKCAVTDREIIVVDSGSFDSCRDMLASEFPGVRFIQSPSNVGFARSNNLGARAATGEYLLLLNPDTEFSEDAISALIQAHESVPDAGALGCRLLNADRTLQSSCVQAFPTVLNQMVDSDFLRRTFPRAKLWGMAALYSGLEAPQEVEAISGACVLIRRELFERIGGFNESYFMYGEDMDLCLKVRRSGAKVYHVPQARLIHFGGGSSGKAPGNYSNVMMRESISRFIREREGPLSASAYRVGMGISALARLGVMAPLSIFGRSVVRHGKGSAGKWTAILKWSLRPQSALNP